MSGSRFTIILCPYILFGCNLYIYIYISSVFFSKAGPSLQAEKPRLQFCRRQVFHRKLKNQGCRFTRDLIGAVASRCFPHPTLSLASEQTLKDLRRSQVHQRGGEGSGFGYLGPPLHRNSPQGLNISSIRVFDQIRDPEIPNQPSPQNGIVTRFGLNSDPIYPDIEG